MSRGVSGQDDCRAIVVKLESFKVCWIIPSIYCWAHVHCSGLLTGALYITMRQKWIEMKPTLCSSLSPMQECHKSPRTAVNSHTWCNPMENLSMHNTTHTSCVTELSQQNSTMQLYTSMWKLFMQVSPFSIWSVPTFLDALVLLVAPKWDWWEDRFNELWFEVILTAKFKILITDLKTCTMFSSYLYMSLLSDVLTVSKYKKDPWMSLCNEWHWSSLSGKTFFRSSSSGKVHDRSGVKGILHQKNFYRLNLIFWIVMGCGIADFDRRGL